MNHPGDPVVVVLQRNGSDLQRFVEQRRNSRGRLGIRWTPGELGIWTNCVEVNTSTGWPNRERYFAKRRGRSDPEWLTGGYEWARIRTGIFAGTPT